MRSVFYTLECRRRSKPVSACCRTSAPMALHSRFSTRRLPPHTPLDLMSDAAQWHCAASQDQLAPTAGAPGQAAGAAATAATPTAASATTAAASSASTAAAASTTAASAAAATASRKLYGALRQNILLVEYVERRQVDVGNFLVTENNFLIWRRVHSRQGCCRCGSGYGCTSRYQREPGSSQHWCRFLRNLCLRRLLRTWHSELPPCLSLIALTIHLPFVPSASALGKIRPRACQIIHFMNSE
jgi:hypothetical protein